MRRLLLAVVVLGLLVVPGHVQAQETDYHRGVRCKRFQVGGSWADVCGLINFHNIDRWPQGMGRVGGESGCNSITWTHTFLRRLINGAIIARRDADDPDTCAGGQYQSTPWYTGPVTDCYAETRAVAYFPGGWVVDTVYSYGVNDC